MGDVIHEDGADEEVGELDCGVLLVKGRKVDVCMWKNRRGTYLFIAGTESGGAKDLVRSQPFAKFMLESLYLLRTTAFGSDFGDLLFEIPRAVSVEGDVKGRWETGGMIFVYCSEYAVLGSLEAFRGSGTGRVTGCACRVDRGTGVADVVEDGLVVHGSKCATIDASFSCTSWTKTVQATTGGTGTST